MESVYFGTEEYHDIINNPVEIGDVTWTVAETNGSVLFNQNDILNEFLHGYAPMDRRLQGFHYLEGTIRVSIVVQGAPYAQGRAVFHAIPWGPHNGTGRYVHQTFNNSRILPHVIVDPTQSATYVLDLPAIGPSGMIDLTKTPYSWGLVGIVYDALGSGTATVPIVDMEIRVTLINPKLRGKIIPKTLAYGLETESLGPSAIIQGVERGLRTHLGGIKLSTYATLFSQLSAQTAEKLKSFGFSRPPSIEVGSTTLVTGDAYTQVDGRSNVFVLGKSQQMPSAINPDLMNGKIEEMDLSYLLSKAVIAHKQSIALTTLPNTLVGSFLVTPDTLGVGTGKTNPSVAKMLHQRSVGWNGSITYSFEFVCSVFHRATMLIAYSPLDIANVSYAEALTSLENINVTVSGNTHVKWTIPWRQAEGVTPFVGDNGRIYVYLIDAIRTNGSNDGIELDVLANHGEVQYHFPYANVPATEYLATTYSQDWIPSSDFALAGDGRPNNSVIAGGDTPRSIKDLTSRANKAFTIVLADTNRYLKNGPFVEHKCWADVIIPWFYGWRGSFRYHGVVDATTAYPERITIGFDPWQGTGETSNSAPTLLSAIQVFNPLVMNGFDVVAPFAVQNRNFNLGQEQRGQSSYFHVRKENTSTVDVYKAAGDDFVVGFFLGVPRIV